MNESSITAQAFAQKLLADAQEKEPQITVELRSIASEISARMVGLVNKFKTEKSLIRKLSLLAEKDGTDQFFEQKLRKFARLNNDALRYTFVFSDDKYAEGFRLAVETLKKKGFEVPPNRIWNAWGTAQTARDTGYRGINITVISSQSQRFELQFHTTESFRLKTETHHFYKELRDLKTSDERRKEIIEEVLKLAEKIERPAGI